MRKHILLGFLLIITSTFYSCSTNDKADTSKIQIDTEFHSFYKDFSELDTLHTAQSLETLKSKYPHFLNFYLDTLVGLNVHGDYANHITEINYFLNYKDFRGLFDTVNIVFPNTKKIDESLIDAFQHIQFYDSTFYIPKHVYYFVSTLNGFTSVIQNEENLGIGLDMFLGESYWGYQAIRVPDYALIKLTPESIPIWVSQSIYQDKYPFYPNDQSLLELMIEKGKEIYYLEKVLPKTSLNLILGYSNEQFNWAEKNEKLIYNTFLQNDLLYEKNQQKIMRYIVEGPNTSGFPAEGPGNLGTFIGWKIIKTYANTNKLSLKEVLNQNNAQEILNKAKYKP